MRQPFASSSTPLHPHHASYDSVEIFAFGFVTLTPSCLARAMISMRFREETACAILQLC